MQRIGYQDIPKGMMEKLMELEHFINNSKIELGLLELVRLRVAQINGCAYCVDMHYKELKLLNETELRLSALCIWEDTPYFSDKERVVLAFTEALTRLSVKSISEEIYTPLTHYFSKEDISYLTLAIAQINTWTQLMKTFGFEPGNYEPKAHEASV